MKITAIESLRWGEYSRLMLVRVHTDSGLVGLGESVASAASNAYAAADKIDWDGVYLRRDIGHRAIARERSAG